MWEDKIRPIGRENVYGVPLGGTAMVALMALYLSPTEEQLTKKRPVHHIGGEIKQCQWCLGRIFGYVIKATDCGSGDIWQLHWIGTKGGN